MNSRIILEYNNFLSNDESVASISDNEINTDDVRDLSIVDSVQDISNNNDINTDDVQDISNNNIINTDDVSSVKHKIVDNVVEQIYNPIKSHPDVIFIIPYRDRTVHLNCFDKIMNDLLERKKTPYTYEMIVSEQSNDKSFNRGAMKNLGFLYAKYKYPQFYKDITFVFNDVDTMPGTDNIVDKYVLDDNNPIKHHFGFNFALGGVFSIKGWLFEKVNGFPNFWGWGFEDNCIEKRITNLNISIDRNDMAPIDDKKWLMLFHGIHRKLDNQVVNKFLSDNPMKNGLSTIKYSNNTFQENYFNNSMYKVINSSWDIPEKHEHIVFETRINPSKVSQRKVQMGNIMRFR